MTTQAPTVRRWMLARELRRLRDESGVTLNAAGAVLGRVRGAVAHLESGRTVPRKQDLRALLELYGAPAGTLDAMEQLRLDAGSRGWWSDHGMPPWLSTYIGLESGAVTLRRFTLELMPGVLQTPDYARTVSTLHGTAPGEAERHVDARMTRRERVLRGDLAVDVVVSEALLSRVSYMGDSGLEQLRQLRDDASRPNVSVRLLLFPSGAHLSMSSSFTILSFSPGELCPVATDESVGGTAVTDDPGLVVRMENVFAALRQQACAAEMTGEVIDEFINAAEEL